jgi:hypothetical protein
MTNLVEVEPLTQEQLEEMKKTDDFIMVRKNAVAIAQTLVHHGVLLAELYEARHNLQVENAMLRQELESQKQMIVRSLQNKIGHGPTS